MSSAKQLLKLLLLLNSSRLILGLLLLLLLFAIANEVAIYNIGLITGDYYKILNNKDKAGFFRQTFKSIGLIVGMALLKSFKDYIASTLYIRWRSRLTSNLHEHYFRRHAYYSLNCLQSNVSSGLKGTASKSTSKINDNVDQRITQDVDKMSNSLSLIAPELIVSPFIMVFYAYKCYTLNGFVGPLGCLVFFLISTVVNRFLIGYVSASVYAQEQREGDFRYQHTRVRTAAESIAFLSGEAVEKDKCDTMLSRLIGTQSRLILHQLFLKISINLCDYLGSILSFIALAIPLFAGAYDSLTPADLSQLISQNAFFVMYLINCFTRLIDLGGYLATFFGTAHRITQLYRWFAANHHSSLSSVSCYQEPTDLLFDIANLSIRPPPPSGSMLLEATEPRPLLANLTFQIRRRQSLLTTGPSGIGKSSLLRTLKDIWPVSGRGSVECTVPLDDSKRVIFLPQKAHLTSGSIAEQIIYPQTLTEAKRSNGEFREKLLEILQFLELEQSILIEADLFLDEKVNWSDYLSAGEVQRLALARVLYHKPEVVFLDESTAALPESMEAKILERLLAMDITLVSAGHRDSLKRFHQLELRLHSREECELVELEI